jgi:hypothetical protein
VRKIIIFISFVEHRRIKHPLKQSNHKNKYKLNLSRTFEESRPSTPNESGELNTSVVSRGKHVHFAPDLNSILAELDEDSVVTFLQEQRDLSADIKTELELSLKRLRQEAHELLDLSARLSNSKYQIE